MITNCWDKVTPIKIPAEHFMIYRGTDGFGYNHHPQLLFYKGKLFATWSNGYVNEDDPGQRMLISISSDYGETWSEPKPLLDRQPGTHTDKILISMGLYEHYGVITAYCGSYEYPENLLSHKLGVSERNQAIPADQIISENDHTLILESTDCGMSWQLTQNKINSFIPNHPPAKTLSGRLIMPGNICFCYTDDPFGRTGWIRTGIPGISKEYADAPWYFGKECHRLGYKHALCESTFFQTADNVIHMMFRTDTYPNFLAAAESFDNGVTWTKPGLTDYTDCGSRTQFGTLPDGWYFGLSCPDQKLMRTPMVIALSNDGITFDKHYILGDEPDKGTRIKGNFKVGGRYGYPALCLSDKYMHVIYSDGKDDISVCRFNHSFLNFAPHRSQSFASFSFS
jgi:hypothetical protein